MSDYYDLDEKPTSLHEWAKLLADDRKIVQQDKLDDGTFVSTVWLGADHNFTNTGPPLIYETMIFPSMENLLDEYCERYPTRADAVAGHKRVMDAIERQGLAVFLSGGGET